MTKTKKQLCAEAVERLKNCVAARFDAESIVIALTSGRHGQSDWSLECDKLIYLLTDDANDDSTPEKVVSGSEPFLTPLSNPNETGNGEDSREKLEADVREFACVYYASHLLVYDKVIELLDRQAAITKQEYYDIGWVSKEEAKSIKNALHKLLDERDHLRRQVDMLNTQVIELTAQRDVYRKRLGKALDLAHEIGELMP